MSSLLRNILCPLCNTRFNAFYPLPLLVCSPAVSYYNDAISAANATNLQCNALRNTAVIVCIGIVLLIHFECAIFTSSTVVSLGQARRGRAFVPLLMSLLPVVLLQGMARGYMQQSIALFTVLKYCGGTGS